MSIKQLARLYHLFINDLQMVANKYSIMCMTFTVVESQAPNVLLDLHCACPANYHSHVCRQPSFEHFTRMPHTHTRPYHPHIAGVSRQSWKI